MQVSQNLAEVEAIALSDLAFCAYVNLKRQEAEPTSARSTMFLLRNLVVCIALGLAFPAIGQQLPDKPAAGAGTDSALRDLARDYPIGPEDVLEISVWKEEGLKKDVLVRPDGGISFPLAGDMQAAGKTASQLQQEITQRLAKFMSDPVVSVAVMKIASNKIYVIGRVNKPGDYLAGRYVDVLQVLSMAGGLTPFAAENDIKVLRKENGKDIVFPFRYSQVKAGNNLDQNIVLKGGDVVVVP
jgi:polysaccharide export outer membrane protein